MSYTLAAPARIAPGWGLFARELAAAVSPRRFMRPEPGLGSCSGNGRPVLVIPGFLASDTSTRPLRLGLGQAGFRAHGWKRGRNFGLTDSIFDIIDARISHIARGEPVALVGWSLGGLIAREFAKHAPERIAKVITLGSPICGDPRQNNNVWRLYELVAGHPVDAPPVTCILDEKPPVETVALWSRRDGIVAADSARAAGSADRSIELGCGHLEMVYAPEAIRAVVCALE
jgi:alpha-beta hydrolase superfamily lysophospholipase